MPYTLADAPFFAALPLLLLGSAFFSGSETALFGLSAHQRLRLIQAPTLIGRSLRFLLADPRSLLVTLMLGNMLMNVLYFVVSSALLLKLDPRQTNPLWVAAMSVGPLLAIIIFGEILPKLVANTARPLWVRVTSLPLYAVHRLNGPLGTALSRWVVRPLGHLFGPTAAPTERSTEELEAMLEMSRRRGVIGADEQQLLREVVLLGRRKVSDVMVPRVDIRAIDVRRGPEDLHELIDRTRLSRYVAVEGDLDHILGIIYTRQFLLASRLNRAVDLRSLVRGVRFVPELLRVDRLLAEFRRTGTQMAIAVDEYGGTAGLITLKDIVEEMVGDLDMDQAPGETPQTIAEQLDENTWRLSGRLSVHDWAQTFAPGELPPRIATVGGLVMALLGRVPQPGDRARLANLELEVERIHGGRVESVLLRLTGPDRRSQSRRDDTRPAPPGGATGGGP